MSQNALTDTENTRKVEGTPISLQDILQSPGFNMVFNQYMMYIFKWYTTSLKKQNDTCKDEQHNTKKQLEIITQFMDELGENKSGSDEGKLQEIQSVIEHLSTLQVNPEYQSDGYVYPKDPSPPNVSQYIDYSQFSTILQEINFDFMKIAQAGTKKQMDSATTLADLPYHTGDSEPIQSSQLKHSEEISNLFTKFTRLGFAVFDAIVEGKVECPTFLRNMLQSLVVSKNMLYSSMKYFMQKYPTWMEEQEDILTNEEYENYKEQLKLIVKVVEEFDGETESDSDDTKKQRLERISELMNQLGSLGHPPTELSYGLNSKQILNEGFNRSS